MHLWHAGYDSKARAFRHRLVPGFGHGLMAALQTHMFELLRMSAAVWCRDDVWFPIHDEPNVLEFEIEHGAEKVRAAYNDLQLRAAVRSRRTQRTEHAGYSDLFVPILAKESVVGVLVAGPFAREAPTAGRIRERWEALAKRPPVAADPEFASYLDAALSVLVLEGAKATSFERYLGCLTKLMAGADRADRVTNEAMLLGNELERLRLPEHMWGAVRTMVDDRYALAWQSGFRQELGNYRLSRVPDQILVGLTLGATAGRDAVEDAVRQNAFQRACVELAFSEGEIIVGQVGSRGVVLLCVSSGSVGRSKQRLLDLSRRVGAMGKKRFGLTLHFGSGIASEAEPFGRSYRAALAAAESALDRGAAFLEAVPGREPAISLWHLRQQLSLVLQERPELLPARFEGYLDAVRRLSGDRMQPMRAQLEIGFERVAEPLVSGGVIDEKALVDIRATLERGANSAATTSHLVAEFRRAIAEMAEAMARPTAARQERSLRRATEHMREHYMDPLRLEAVARIAGLTPGYFSKLLVLRERSSFAKYLLRLRIERAKQLLQSTDVEAARVSRMCGFKTPQYFSHVFRRETGSAPQAWRQTVRSRPAAPTGKRNRKLRKP